MNDVIYDWPQLKYDLASSLYEKMLEWIEENGTGSVCDIPMDSDHAITCNFYGYEVDGIAKCTICMFTSESISKFFNVNINTSGENVQMPWILESKDACGIFGEIDISSLDLSFDPCYETINMDGPESIIDAYNSLLKKLTFDTHVYLLGICDLVFDKILDIVSDPSHICTMDMYKYFYDTLTEFAQYMHRDVRFERENKHMPREFDVLPELGANESCYIYENYDDSIIKIRMRNIGNMLVRYDIIPSTLSTLTNYDGKTRFNVLLKLDDNTATNAKREIDKKIRECIKEEIFDMHENAKDTVKEFIRNFPYSYIHIKGAFSIMLLLASAVGSKYTIECDIDDDDEEE